MTAKTKKAAADAAKARARKAGDEKRAHAAAEKRAKQEARNELAAIEDEESRLRDRRQALQRKYHLRSV